MANSNGWTFNTSEGTLTEGPKITAICVVFAAISLIAVSLRLYVRTVLIKAMGIDDWIIFGSWVSAAVFSVITILQAKWGLGLQDIDDMPPENIYNFGLLQFAGAPFYIGGILGFKLALLTSYYRFVPVNIWRPLLIVTLVLCVLFHLTFLIVQVNLCQPIAKQWDPSITVGSCIPGVPFYTSMASLTIFFDIVIMIFPFPILFKSQIQKRKKIVVLSLFGTGIFITIIQVIRIQKVAALANYLDSAGLILWSVIEMNLGIIVACIPTLSPLFRYFRDKSYRSRSNGEGNTSDKHTSAGARYALSAFRKGTHPTATGMHSLHSDGESQEEFGHKAGAKAYVYSPHSDKSQLSPDSDIDGLQRNARGRSDSTDQILDPSSRIVKHIEVHVTEESR